MVKGGLTFEWEAPKVLVLGGRLAFGVGEEYPRTSAMALDTVQRRDQTSRWNGHQWTLANKKLINKVKSSVRLEIRLRP